MTLYLVYQILFLRICNSEFLESSLLFQLTSCDNSNTWRLEEWNAPSQQRQANTFTLIPGKVGPKFEQGKEISFLGK
jgi:hypothetical protein